MGRLACVASLGVKRSAVKKFNSTFFEVKCSTDQRYGKFPPPTQMNTVRQLARHLTRCEIAPQKHCLSATHGGYGIMNLLAVPRQCGALVGVYGQEKHSDVLYLVIRR